MSFVFSLIAQTNLGQFTNLGSYAPGADEVSAATSLSNLISNIIGLLTIVAGTSFLIYFAIGGLTWITSGGDTTKVDAAKNRMTGGAIGMIIITATWSIAWIIGRVLGFDLLNPTKTIQQIGPQEVIESSTSEPQTNTDGGQLNIPTTNYPTDQ